MKLIPILLVVGCLVAASPTTLAQNNLQRSVMRVLDEQSAHWNAGNLEAFMGGYWRNDSLMFLGKSGATYGWQATLDNYKKGYPDTVAMGKLRFEMLRIEPLGKEYAYVVGKWFLSRRIGNLSGAFSLIMRRIKGNWIIIADHSS